jgi:NAD(P)-dependent dehydrogenase (short-subunit alcohol dehydrogenase family)
VTGTADRNGQRELSGRIAIVTGGAGGIGSAIVETLARDGATVVAADIDGPAAKTLAERLRGVGLEVSASTTDIVDRDAVKQLVAGVLADHGRIDILVNNAAIDAPPGLAWEIDAAHWLRVIDTNLTAQWWCTAAVMPHMMKERSGRIIFMSSVSARAGDVDISVAYSAAKAGLIGLTIALSVHLDGYGIRVNAIAPGATGTTGTPMTDRQRLEAEAGPFGLMGAIPVADACLYLARSSGDHITGSVLNVSSGQWRG